MKKILIIGGKTKKNATELDVACRHEKGVVLSLDLKTKKMDKCFEYKGDHSCLPSKDFSVTFKSGHLENDRLYLCTNTEILVLDVSSFELLHHISHPYFNDVHHVRPTGHNTLLVVSTGLDAVFELTFDSEIVNEWSSINEDVWHRFNKKTDYRKVNSTKPHKSHPNFVFMIDEKFWVTRFEQRDAICLNHKNKRFDIKIQRPHDGHINKDKIFFTSVDGHVIIADINTKKIREIVDLNKIHRNLFTQLGWCRSLYVLNHEEVIVGFSRFRPTKFKANISWLRKNLKSVKNAPAHIAAYNLKKKKLLWEVNTENFGLNVIFSIL